MRIAHGPPVHSRVERDGKSNDVPLVRQPAEGKHQVFVRAVWRSRRLVALGQGLREMGVPPRRNADVLGVSRRDFADMTRGLFDR